LLCFIDVCFFFFFFFFFFFLLHPSIHPFLFSFLSPSPLVMVATGSFRVVDGGAQCLQGGGINAATGQEFVDTVYVAQNVAKYSYWFGVIVGSMLLVSGFWIMYRAYRFRTAQNLPFWQFSKLPPLPDVETDGFADDDTTPSAATSAGTMAQHGPGTRSAAIPVNYTASPALTIAPAGGVFGSSYQSSYGGTSFGRSMPHSPATKSMLAAEVPSSPVTGSDFSAY
jgi:hypothetical protein